jgi:hypothetical protein
MHVIIWLLTLLAVGLWSVLAWGAHFVLTLDPGMVGGLKPLVDQIPYGALLEQWIPGWRGLLLATIEFTQSMLGWLGGAAGVIVWVVWALGAALLLLAGAVGSVLVALARKAARAAAASASGRGPDRAQAA